MKKGIKLIIILLICITMVGCSNDNDKKGKQAKKDDTSELKTNEKIKTIFESNGFEVLNAENEMGTVDSFAKNHELGEVFIIYGSIGNSELYYQFKGSIMFIDKKELVSGSEDKEEIYKSYETTIKKLGLTKKEITSFLKNEQEMYKKKQADNLNAHKFYKPDIYEVGKDISEDEYLIIATDKLEDASVKVDSTSYNSSETETFFTDINFKSTYVKVKLGQFLKVEKANIYSVSDRPTLNLQENGIFKVGVDLEPGMYNLHSQNESAYYSIITLNSENEFELEANDYGFTNDLQIKVNEGEYLELKYITITKVQ